MLEDKLIPAVEKAFDETCAGNCENCDNVRNCKGSCITCLDQVHWYHPGVQGRSDYTCQNLIFKYVLMFNNRYKNQVLSIQECVDLSKFPRYDIFSIGCGSAPDLMAFEEMTKKTGKSIYYKGYDKNPLWKPIHKYIEEYTSRQDRIKASLRRRDIFDVFSEGKPLNHQYNVVIIQYLISHLFNTGQNFRINSLYDYVISNILRKRSPKAPLLIALFDIDSMNKGRNEWYNLLDKLEQQGFHGNAYSKSFYDNGDLGAERWSRNKNSSTYGNIAYHYQKNDSEHDGAQFIIELE